ncbi:MAG: hypothetical protein IT460_08435 [Planctomycetes bacterium]|nr:hypothetical protein [Planctomycetota bacterium]
MTDDVRVHVRLGTLRLDYEGARAFYESKVEALVASAASRGTGGAPVVESAAAMSAAASAPAPVDPPPAPPTPPPPSGFVPKTPEFGRYLRRLGPEAGEPDRQVVALGFYLWNYERREAFGRVEIEGCFKALGLPAPKDLDAVFADLTDRKRFLETVGEGAYRLSKKGENYVKTRLLSA